MTTVESWDEYTWKEQEEIIEKGKFEEKVGKFLEASITLDTAWGITRIFIFPRTNTKGCKSFLLSYLLQKIGLKKIRVSKQQLHLIETNKYTYKEITTALKEIIKHPEWIKNFKKEIQKNKKLYEFTFNMTTDELRPYY